ncbi:MAG: type II toxin-antitoxin system prevent-host-death family antitoxin [Deltaproteobacteria bacterium]|nr:type II toxin-antitoxin system prevent-host-death family antitoxin [Deltaproteobacteria bacterium]MBT7205405.1 type II toxin-antitoxin system prevent-host-death family antitoxin [Deltaproteobacteria bacterium]
MTNKVLMKTISVRDTNRHFPGVLREVTAGEVITVLSRSTPVATIAPAQMSDLQRDAAPVAVSLHDYRSR